MAARTCTPAAAAAAFVLRVMPAAARNQFVHPIPFEAEQHKNGTREPTEEEMASILNELDKAEDVLRQRDKEVEELNCEMKRVTKILAVSFVGLTALSASEGASK